VGTAAHAGMNIQQDSQARRLARVDVGLQKEKDDEDSCDFPEVGEPEVMHGWQTMFEALAGFVLE